MIIECFISNKILTKKNIHKIFNFFSDEIELINKEECDILIEKFNVLYKELEELIGKDNSFNKIMSIIFKNEFIKVHNEYFRKQLLDIILSNNDFILNNAQLFRIIIPYDSSPEGMSTKIDFILNNNNPCFKILDKCKNEFYEQISNLKF